MRPRRAFQPAGDALEARWVTSSLVPHHAAAHHAEVHHARHPAAHAAKTAAAADPAITLVNLFPFAAGTTFISNTTTPATSTTVLASLPATGSSGTASTLFAQSGPGYAIISALPSVTYPGTSLGAGGDLNGLVLFGGPEGTPGGDLDGLVIY